jgi:hypothetical protein
MYVAVVMIKKLESDTETLAVLLTRSGISFEVVERCPDAACEICAATVLEAA